MRLPLLSLLSFFPMVMPAQINLSGSVQSDVLVGQRDHAIGADKTNDVQSNTYANIQLSSRYVDAGARLEYMEQPLPGFEPDFKGWGVPHVFVKSKLKDVDLTIGTFYEQFGCGFILRTYEERSLGMDNALAGARVVAHPFKGVAIKALSGRQRRYWSLNKSLVSGTDAEFNIDEWIPALTRHNTRLMLGASWVNRRENNGSEVFADATHRVRFPKYVNAWDMRTSLNKGGWDVLLEYAQKTDDPSYANGYIFRKGTAALLSGSYSRKGMSVLVQTKRSENMSFKSTGVPSKAIGIASSINHLPSFTHDHSYTLATLYPWSTQMADGEWAYQGEMGYLFRRGTALGGRYGTSVKANLSYVKPIRRRFINKAESHSLAGTTDLAGTEGYHTSFIKWGSGTYYQDLNVELTKKMTAAFKLTLMYMNQRYNQTVAEGHGGMVDSHIFIAEGQWNIGGKIILRSELQYLTTCDDLGDWGYALAELSIAPNWSITASDLYNAGNTHTHFYQIGGAYSLGSHRIQVGYGRTRAGYNCSGGVCRYVPASKGVTLSYNYTF